LFFIRRRWGGGRAALQGGAVFGDQEVLSEQFDTDYQPTQQEIEDFAVEHLNMDIDEDACV
jgi:hypothetical protein